MALVTLEPLVHALAARLRARGWRIAVAESCTGGLVAAACTAVAGSSEWFERGFVSYSNASKTELLGVAAPLIERHGAVSEAVVAAMALGALERAPVQLAAAVSGIAGPGGAVPGKPVGTVWVAWAARVEGVPSLWRVERLTLGGDRSTIRESAAARVLGGLLDAVSAAPG